MIFLNSLLSHTFLAILARLSLACPCCLIVAVALARGPAQQRLGLLPALHGVEVLPEVRRRVLRRVEGLALHEGRLPALVERFDIEPLPDFSAK